MLAGLMVSPFPAAGFQPMNELRALIGGDADALHDVIDIFIASVGIIPFNVVSSAAGNIMSLVTPVSTPDLSLSELATHVHTAMAAGTLTGGQAIAMVVRFAPSYNQRHRRRQRARGGGPRPRRRWLHRARGGAGCVDAGSTSAAARYLVAVAAVDPAALPAAALRFATLVDTTTPTFMISGNMMTAQQAVTAINVGISLGGLSGASAVVMLTAMAFVPGGSQQPQRHERRGRRRARAARRHHRRQRRRRRRGRALGPLGFTPEQGVTFLVALGASGIQQIFGSSVIWVNNADLAAAASAAIAGLIHDHGLSAAAIGAALDAAFPLGADNG